MPEYPVIGCHRSGTSLVASLMEALGINMGDRMHPPTHWNPLGHYEDLDFWEINHRIYAATRTNLIPKREELTLEQINEAGKPFLPEIKELVESKQKRAEWGWKDPLNVMMIYLYLPYLKDPRFVVVRRSVEGIADSLLRGHGGDWTPFMCVKRASRLVGFVKKFEESNVHPSVTIQFESLIDRSKSEEEVKKLAEFIGSDEVDRAMEVIRYKED